MAQIIEAVGEDGSREAAGRHSVLKCTRKSLLGLGRNGYEGASG